MTTQFKPTAPEASLGTTRLAGWNAVPQNPMQAMGLLLEPPPWNAEDLPPAPQQIGASVLGNSIPLYHAGKANLLIFGGVHGDESEAVFLAHLLLAAGVRSPLIPCLNPDGALLRQRWNRSNVDLNRNLPTPDWQPEALNPRYPPGAKPGSEPETQALLRALEITAATTVLSLHSYTDSFVEVERPETELPPALNRAVAAYCQQVGIVRKASIGYPTPGAFGAFARANGLLGLTYELPRGSSHAQLAALIPPLLALVEALAEKPFVAP